MKVEYRKALTEVEKILENTDKELVDKIPKDFMEFIKANKAVDYNFEVNKEKGLLEQEISDKTKALLSLIYRDYFCDKEEREKLIKKEREEEKIAEEEKRKKYNPDNIFQKEENKIDKQEEIKEKQPMELVKYEELKWYQKIYQKILKIFKIK